jgi:hypothetical protein
MKVLTAAVVLLLATLGGAASTQTNGHVGPPSPSGQWPNIPSAPGAGTDGRPESGDLHYRRDQALIGILPSNSSFGRSGARSPML